MKTLIKFCFIAITCIVASSESYCQTFDPSKILGSWVFNKFTFLTALPDTASMIKESEGATVTFIEGNKFISKHTVNDKSEEETGSYSIDGKYITQGETKAEIIALNDKEFIIKVPEVMIIHFLRVENLK